MLTNNHGGAILSIVIKITFVLRKEGKKMTDTKLLRETIDSSGMSITFISNEIGISREALYKKISNTTEFKASEITKLSKILNLSNRARDVIFFDTKVI